jgi:ribonucleoside-triphosphate reductase
MFDYAMAGGVKKTFAKLYRENAVKILKFYDIQLNAKEYLKDETPSLTDHEEFDKKEFEFLNSLKEVPNVKRFQELVYEQTKADTTRRTFQAMEAFIHNLNTMHSRAGAQVPFSSINFGTDTSVEGRMVTEQLLKALDAGLGNGETPIFPILIFKVKEGVNYNPGDPNYDLLRLSCKVSSKRLFPNFSFIDAPFNLQYYKEGHPETECAYMGCRTRVIGNVCGPEIVTGRGNLSFTSINLPSLGIKHGVVSNPKADIDGFFKELDEKLDLVIGQLLQRFDLQGKKRVKNFPFLMGQGVWLGSEKLGFNDTLQDVIRQGTLTVGFIGLAECLKALIGEHHGESEDAQKLGLEIIGHMRKRMDEASQKYQLNFSVIATPAEGLSGRFVKIDKKRYGIIPGVTDRDYYTNSFHVPVYFPISAFKKLAIEGKYHALTNAGHISYVELDGDPLKNLEAFEQVVRCMKESGIGYGSINHPVDRDPVCGYTGIIDNECPSCGRTEGDDEGFERIRRITGYLVGTVDRFNNAKSAEVRERVKHSVGVEELEQL